MHCRMDRNKLNIGTCILSPYARTEAHIRDLKDCGIDFVVAVDCDRDMLDLFDVYGVGAVVKGVVPGFWGGDGTNAGTMEKTNPLSAYEKAAETFTDHPAIWGIDCGDEPSCLDFGHFGKAISVVQKHFPNQFAYLNLYPSYGVRASTTETERMRQLGADSFETYLDAYCRKVPLDYICYDFYQYAASPEEALENLQIASACAKRYGKSLWIVLQVNSDKETAWITENQLRHQAFSAMAYGVENIIWACYTAGWWYNHVLDKKGVKTVQFDRLKQVNKEIHTLAEIYMQYKAENTFRLDEKSPSQSGVTIQNGGKLLVGELIKRNGTGKGRILFAADDPYDKGNRETEIIVSGSRNLTVHSGAGEIPLKSRADGSYMIQMTSNQAVIITEE